MRHELQTAVGLARAAGDVLMSYYRRDVAVERKAGNEPVTEADRESSRLIVEGLSNAFPNDAVLSEEAPDDGSRLKSARAWMVDPMDGTKDFMRGEQGFSVMIGLCDHFEPVLGVVFQPTTGRLWSAARGLGAYAEDSSGTREQIRVSSVSDLSQARLVTSKSHRDQLLERARKVLGVADDLEHGSVGLKVGFVASATRDLYVNTASKTKLWDACAGHAILVEAGGRVTDMGGQPLRYGGRELRNLYGILATNGHLHDAAIERLKPIAAVVDAAP